MNNNNKDKKKFLSSQQGRYLKSRLKRIAMLHKEVASQNNPQKMLQLLTESACKLLGVKYGVFGIVGKNMNNREYQCMTTNRLKGKDKPTRLSQDSIKLILGSANVLVVDECLSTAICTNSELYGYFYVGIKLDGTKFNELDHLMMRVIASEIALIYENYQFHQIFKKQKNVTNNESASTRKILEELNITEALLRGFSENTKDVFWESSPNFTRMLYINRAYEDVWGRSRENLYQNLSDWLEAVIPQDRDKVKDFFTKQIRRKHVSQIAVEYKISRPDGSIRAIYNRGFSLVNRRGKLISLFGVATDITLLKMGKTITKLLFDTHKIFEKFSSIENESEDILRLICKAFSWSSGEIWLFSKNNSISTCMSQWPAKNNQLIKSLASADLKSKNMNNLDQSSANDCKVAITLPIIFKDKYLGMIHFYINKSLFIDAQAMQMITQALTIIVSRLAEFYEHKYINKKLIYISSHDMLTGLLDRFYFTKQVDQDILAHSSKKLFIIVVDIDKLKIINNALGYLIGDQIILSIADRLLDFTKKNNGYISKLGADKFALVLHKNISTDLMAEYSQQLLKSISDPIKVNEDIICVTLSIGISIYPENGNDCITLIKNADSAMSQVKEKGGNYYQFYDLTLSPQATEKFKLINELHSAVANHEFVLHYQPKIETNTGKILGVEALVRWNNPERGLLSPLFFLHAAEETGLIIPISEWVLREVFKLIISRKLNGLPVAVNLSIVQFKIQYDLISYVKNLMEEFNVHGAKLEYEVTESLLMMSEQNSLLVLNKLQQFGSKVSFDDFGTGYSSFSYLKYFIPNTIKIDKIFIDNLPNNRNICKIVEAMILLAHNLNIKVIAEGVEKAEQFNYLKQCGCDQIQGFYFSKALPLNELIKLVNESTHCHPA